MNMIRLNDGHDIPAVGFGVFMIPNDGPTYDAVLQALKIGYRHIDTAAAYFNESDVGKAIRDSGIPRSEIFITSKLWLQDYGYAPAKKGIEASLHKLGTDYIDLYLLHQPYGLRVLGKIVNVIADEKILDDNGKIDAGKLNAFVFDQTQNGYYAISEKIGQAWHSGAALMRK